MNKIPKLRFKEFLFEWKEIKFKEFLTERKEIATEKEELYSLTIEKGVTPKEERYEREFLVNDEKEAYKLVLKNDFVYNPMNVRFGAIAQFTEDKIIKVSKYYSIFYCNNINSYFFEKFIKTKRMFKLYNKLATGSLNEKKRLHFLEFLEIKQPFPHLEEQKKIADFLSAVDVKISLTEEKLDLLKKYKKSVIQKIFNQNLRFKDKNKNNYPNWEEKKLKNITKFSKGKLISKEDISEVGTECIRYGELYTTYNEVITNVVSKTHLDSSNLVLSEENDIIIPCSGETAIDIAKASCVTKSGIALGGDLNILKLNENGIFLSYYLNNKAKYQIASLAQGAGVVHLYEEHLKKLNIKLPCLEEQQKIADFLSSIDNKIEKLSSELEYLKEFKKGLLQQMFV